jgi:hypothetical protein
MLCVFIQSSKFDKVSQKDLGIMLSKIKKIEDPLECINSIPNVSDHYKEKFNEDYSNIIQTDPLQNFEFYVYKPDDKYVFMFIIGDQKSYTIDIPTQLANYFYTRRKYDVQQKLFTRYPLFYIEGDIPYFIETYHFPNDVIYGDITPFASHNLRHNHRIHFKPSNILQPYTTPSYPEFNRNNIFTLADYHKIIKHHSTDFIGKQQLNSKKPYKYVKYTLGN